MIFCSVVGPLVAVGVATDARAQTCSVERVVRLVAFDASTYDFYGNDVAIDNDTVVIGALKDGDNGPNSGSAYVYRSDGESYNFESKLLANGGMSFDNFGQAVAIDGDTILIGARGYEGVGVASGAAFFYTYEDGQWIEWPVLLPSDGQSGDSFGSTVALSNDIALIAAEGDDDIDSRAGSVYVYRYVGGAWKEGAKLVTSDGTAYHCFGKSILIHSETVILTACNDHDLGENAGSAYVFRNVGGEWVQEKEIYAADGAAGAAFGYSGAICGDVAVIGALKDSELGHESGAAYVFRYNGSDWIQEAKLTPDDPSPGQRFGVSVDISGDTIVIGADNDRETAVDAGAAYIFKFDGLNWVQDQKILDSSGQAEDWFGRSVGISGQRVVVGAYLDDDGADQAGSATIYNVDCPMPCIPDVNGDGVLASDDFTAWVGAFNSMAPRCDQNGDGMCTPTDFTAWVANYNAGC